MRKILAGAALILGLLGLSAPGAQAAPAHAARAMTSCRSTDSFWDQIGPTPLYDYGALGNPAYVLWTTSGQTQQEFCQFSSGYTLDGFLWFEYQDVNTGLCVTWNESAKATDEVTCQGLASQEWTATNQHNCKPPGSPYYGECEWAIGNAWYLINYGNNYALDGQGNNTSPVMYTYNGTSDPYGNWWVLPTS